MFKETQFVEKGVFSETDYYKKINKLSPYLSLETMDKNPLTERYLFHSFPSMISMLLKAFLVKTVL